MRKGDLFLVVAIGGAVAGGTAYVAGIDANVDRHVRESEARVSAMIRSLEFQEPQRFRSPDGPSTTTNLIPASEGFCFLTRVSGSFAGNGEWAEVVREDGLWKLRTDSINGSGAGAWVYADAHCLRYPEPHE